MITQEKKFFAPVLKTYKNDLSKRWRIEYQIPIANTLIPKRVVLYGEINKGFTVDERLQIANEILSTLNFVDPKPTKANILEKTIQLNSGEWRLSTKRAYSTILNSFLEFLNGVSPSKVNTQIILDYIIHLIDTGASQNKINKYREGLHTLYKRAMGYKLITENPVPLVKSKKKKGQSKLFFNEEQIKKFKLITIENQVWLGIQLLYYCYIRPREQRSLKLNAINFSRSYIEIPADISKNNKSQRVIIPLQLMKYLEYLKEYGDDNYIFGRDGVPGKKMVGINWLNYQHSKILKKLEISGRFSVYSWKHTGVVKAVKSGINIKDLQLQLRHHSLDQVDEYLKDLGIMDSKEILNNFPTL